MTSTQPVFVLGSGRSGTFQMAKLLGSVSGVDAHHEYLFENILKSAVMYRMGRLTEEEICSLITDTHVAAISYSKSPVWVDSSNALPWIIKPLRMLFPNARFVHLIRDGRKVVSSFFYKFTEVMYDDESVEILQKWLKNPLMVLTPPPEKRYWRPVPIPGEPYYEEFASYDRFQRLCYYWQDINITIHQQLADLSAPQKTFFHLEKVVSDRDTLSQFLSACNVDYNDAYLDQLKRPINVAIPKNYLLTDTQKDSFDQIAGHAMRLFRYDGREEYKVVY